MPFEWHYLIQHTREWNESTRPLPSHVKWETYYEPGKYDFALLHVDQQSLSPKIAYGKYHVFNDMKEQIKDIPIIVVNHGTTVYPELFMMMAEAEGFRASEKAGEQWAAEKMKKMLEGVAEMVVNSHKAREMWGWGKTIVHGLDEEEWFDLPKEPRVVTMISAAGMGEKYYGRRFYNEVRDLVKEKSGIEPFWIGEKGKFAPNWNYYKRYIGSSLVYFNPTIGSPMPRSRTEAMMSGACVVTTGFQDADMFIEHGKNGLLVKLNPGDAADKIIWCMEHYKDAVAIGQRGRETARKIFSGERFRNEWVDLVGKVLGRDLGYLKGERNSPDENKEITKQHECT